MYKGGTRHVTLPVAFHSGSKNVYKTVNSNLLLCCFIIQLKRVMKDIII